MRRLTDDDLRTFAADGYLLVPDVVPEALLAAADAEIDGLVADPATPPVEGDGGPGVTAWFPPPSRLPACDALLRDSAALAIADELVAPGHLARSFDHVQVSTTRPPFPDRPGGPHIDGYGLGGDAPASFTLLAGILLTDQADEDTGNLWVWPGSHLAHRDLFHERGTFVLEGVVGHATLLDPPVALAAPRPVRGHRGDLLLAHHLLGHNKGSNTGPEVRRTVYHRLAVAGHAERWEATYLDPWTEYPPVRAALARREG